MLSHCMLVLLKMFCVIFDCTQLWNQHVGWCTPECHTEIILCTFSDHLLNSNPMFSVCFFLVMTSFWIIAQEFFRFCFILFEHLSNIISTLRWFLTQIGWFFKILQCLLHLFQGSRMAMMELRQPGVNLFVINVILIK